MSEPTPVMVAVAPNGARHSRREHPGLPLRPVELAATAVSCAEAGATMVHLHVRDAYGRHSLEPSHYAPAIDAVKQAIGDSMLLQVTSEAAGVYSPAQQIELMSALAPEALSVAIREFFADPVSSEAAAEMLARLAGQGTLLQYILYDPSDVRRYHQLLGQGMIPAGRQMVLFVLGRYGEGTSAVDLSQYVGALDSEVAWMACAFGSRSFAQLTDAVASGGHVRIGFENSWLLPDGSVAADNAVLVKALARRLAEAGRRLANIEQTRALFAE